MTKSNKLSIGLLLGCAVVIGALLGASYLTKVFGANTITSLALNGSPVNLIGSQVGTTTTAVGFYELAASTTYPVRIGANTDTVAITLLALEASTSGATVNLSLLGSNDRYCDTASTSAGTLLTTVTGDINWYDVSKNILNLAGSATTISTATSSIQWTPTSGSGKQIVLTNLNAECLALEVSATSTRLMSQVITKSFRKE